VTRFLRTPRVEWRFGLIWFASSSVVLLLLMVIVTQASQGGTGAAQTTFTNAPARQAPLPTTFPATTGSGELKVDLGTRPLGFGSQGQASELLRLIEQNPGKAAYSISYRSTSDVVVFGCDFAKDALVRVHQEPNNRGTGETWKGYIIERLRYAAAGGSLNDTPAGKTPGSYQRF
jgi:hypothetical protein